MNTIHDQWESFSALAIPKTATSAQRRDMKYAFYTGVAAMVQIQWAVDDSAVSEEAAVQILEGCYQELENFGRQIAAG